MQRSFRPLALPFALPLAPRALLPRRLLNCRRGAMMLEFALTLPALLAL